VKTRFVEGELMTAVSVPPGVADILARSAAAAPTGTALIADGVEHTFTQLVEAADAIAAQLVPGTRVLVRLTNDAASVVAIHAAWRAGCSVVAASTMVPEPEVVRRASETSAASIIAPAADGGLSAHV
jgi:long-chain acyl-CoA synthetase